MANVADRWHKSYPKPGEPVCAEHGEVPAREHMDGHQWQVRWKDGGRAQSRNFRDQAEAKRYLAHLDSSRCLVPDCKGLAATDPPVLLCEPHRDLVISQAPRKRRPAHEPLVYFVRNGNRVKIGWTSNLKVRLTQMSAPAGSVVLTFPGERKDEKALHYRFAAARIGRSEWFEATAEIEEYIASRTDLTAAA